VVVLEVEQKYLKLMEVPIQVEVQVETVDLEAVLDFTTPKLVELQLVLLSLALLATLQILVGDMLVVEVVIHQIHKTHSIMPVVAAVPVVLDPLVEMEHMVVEEQVETVTYSQPISKYQHQLCHPLHGGIQDQLVVHTG
jgi:hypothetical protein